MSIERIEGDRRRSADLTPFAGELRDMALRALPRMIRPGEGLFAFRLRRSGSSVVLEGTSRRYSAIVLIGLAGYGEEVSRRALGGASPRDLCRKLLHDAQHSDNLGDVALTLWAAFRQNVSDFEGAWERFIELDPFTGHHSTVECAWALTALSHHPDRDSRVEEMAARMARRLLGSFRRDSGMFPHWPEGVPVSRMRAHVCCFADFVYPIQAFSHYHRRSGDPSALSAARVSADRMCALQGPAGQWWWHFDIRTGRVIEGYPVYAVHQNSMAPMALFDLWDAGGEDHIAAIQRGLQWLSHSPEIDGSLVDRGEGLIWRKVARHEPGKAARSIQALASRIHPSFRFPGIHRLMKPGWIDFESRPYHMGWILYAWTDSRLQGLVTQSAATSEARFIGSSTSFARVKV